MSNIPEVYLLQATKKNLELAKAFQNDMSTLSFEYAMYDVKDALTSILALCDMEDMKQISQVKKYIQRVADLLQEVRLFYSSSLFNANQVVINVINVLKHKYKSRINITDDLTPIKASVKSDKSHLEQILLYFLIEAVESSQTSIQLKVEIVQRERDAVITLRLAGFEYSPVAIKEIRTMHNPSAFRMQIYELNGSVEMVIRLPLSFENREKSGGINVPSASLALGELKRIEIGGHTGSNHADQDHGKKGKQTALVRGAQERT